MIKNYLKSKIYSTSRIIPNRFCRYVLGDYTPIFVLHRMEHKEYGINGHNFKKIQSFLEYFRKKKYNAISLEDYAKYTISGEGIPPNSVIFTIDDGFIDQYVIAGPLFSEYDIPLTYFLVTDFIDNKIWPWDAQINYIFEHG